MSRLFFIAFIATSIASTAFALESAATQPELRQDTQSLAATLAAHEASLTTVINAMQACALRGAVYAPSNRSPRPDAQGCVTPSSTVVITSYSDSAWHAHDYCALSGYSLLTHRSAGLPYSCTVSHNSSTGRWRVQVGGSTSSCSMMCIDVD